MDSSHADHHMHANGCVYIFMRLANLTQNINFWEVKNISDFEINEVFDLSIKQTNFFFFLQITYKIKNISQTLGTTKRRVAFRTRPKI